MNYKETFSPATKQEISKVENFIGTLLPSDYTAFLMKIGGGLLKTDNTNKLYIEDINDAVVMDILFDSKQVLECTKEFQTEMYDYCAIIGESLTYGFIVLVCEGNNKGVYYWDHTYYYECSNDENNVYWLADSFTDFMNQIH